jgi:hypothetical protein
MQVADCYIHVQYQRLHREEFDELSERLLREATALSEIVKRGTNLDFTFEEGTLFQRILLIGTLTMSTLDFASHYHDLRESVADMVHDGETFSNYAIKKFHEITGTSPKQDIYKRTSSRDMNRLRRIIHSFDQAAGGNIPRFELSRIRRQVIHDLAGLARANPNDPEIAKIFKSLPKDHIPDLPTSPSEAIAIDETEFERKTPSLERPEVEGPSRRPRRRFHKRISLQKRRSR